MADDTKQFKVDIVGEDNTAGAFAAIEASYRKLGLTAEQVDAEVKRLESVNEEDSLAQHFRAAEVELRRLGLTSEAVAGEMAHLHGMGAAPAESEFARAEAAFAQLGLSTKQLHAQMESLEEISKHDVAAQHFEAAEQQIRALGLTSKASTEMVEGLRKAVEQAEADRMSGYDRWMGRLQRFGRRSEGGEGGEGGEHEEHPGHGWDGISAHFNILRDHFGELRENVGETRESLAEMFPMLAGFGAIASAAGLVELIHSTAEEQAQLEAMSKQLGIGAEQLEALHYAANMSDVGIETMDKSMGKLGVTIQEAVSGHDKAATAIFAKMGIHLKDAHGHLVPMTTILPEVAQALKNTADPQMRLFVATQLFGKAGRDMLPLLIQGAAHIKDLTAEADKLGPALTDLDRDHLEQFNDAWKQAQYVSESFMTKLGADLAPVMTPLLDDFTEFVAANKAWIAEDVSGAVQKTADAIKGFPWDSAIAGAKALGTDIGDAAKDINSVVSLIPGGWKTVIEGFAIYKAASPFAHILSDAMLVAKLGVEMVDTLGKKIPTAIALADKAWDAFSASGVAAFKAIQAAEMASDKAFGQTLLGKTMAISFAVADAGEGRTRLTPAQQKVAKTFGLQPNQAVTPDQLSKINAAGPSIDNWADQKNGPDVDDYASKYYNWARTHLFGFGSPETAPTVPLPGARDSSAYAPRPGAMDEPAGRDSTVRVQISFDNAPQNMNVTTTSDGSVSHSVDVGYNRMLGTTW